MFREGWTAAGALEGGVPTGHARGLPVPPQGHQGQEPLPSPRYGEAVDGGRAQGGQGNGEEGKQDIQKESN